jgi:hypothetical protein
VGLARKAAGESLMEDRDIGRAINITGMIGVLAGLVVFAFAVVFLIFRRGFGFEFTALRWFW